MMEELLKKVLEIKGMCADRLDAVSADGNKLDDVFVEVEEFIKARIKKKEN